MISTPPYLLSVHNVSKQYGTLSVLHQINFELKPGEVVGIAGRNGSGKSTLINIIAGLLSADSGTIVYQQQRLNTQSQQAIRPQMSVIHQTPQLVNQLDATTNIFLGQELGWSFFNGYLNIPNMRAMEKEAERVLTRLDAPFIPFREPVAGLSAEQRQLIAIARVMVSPQPLILIDDPNFDLSIPYRQKLLRLVRIWQANGAAVLFSDNNLDNLFAVADRLLVLHNGRVTVDVPADETSREAVVGALVSPDRRNDHTPAIWAMDSFYQAREQAEHLRHNLRLLERDLQARDQLNLQLVEQLAEQVKALDSANGALQDAQRRLLTEREDERKHLAREIHDQAIQDLLSLNYELEEIEDRVVEATATVDDVVEIRQSIRVLVEDLRRICGNLRPPTIDSLGLDGALRSYSRQWSARTRIEVSLKIEDGFGRLPEAIELSIFRIVQEALNNIWKHAQATHASVKIEASSPRLLLVSIGDNGRGLSTDYDLAAARANESYGLLGISERVALLGGRLRFVNQNGGGLLVQAEIPHPKTVRG